MAGPTKFKTLKATHPSLNVKYVQRLRALYRGGTMLLGNPQLLREIFPKHFHEGEQSYKERCDRAIYDNEFAMVINKIIAGLAQDPLSLVEQTGDDGKPIKLEAYWQDLMDDATPPQDDGEKKTFDQVMREVMTEALVCRRGWVLAEMPQSNPNASSLLDQEQSGALRAYPVPYQADSVINWEEQGGHLLWVRVYTADRPALTPEDDREFTVHTWRVWDAVGITTYQIELNDEGKQRGGGDAPKDDDLIAPIGPPIAHSFGRVPWVCIDMGAPNEPQMWVGDIIESRVRSQFNEVSSETFSRLRSMFQQLYEFLGKDMSGPDEPISEAQQDPNRAPRNMAQRAPDIVQVRGNEDDAKFIAPDMASADVNRAALADGRESIMRVTGQLALASDTSGAMIKRSGDSKKQDKIAEEVVLGATGKKGRSAGQSVIDLLNVGRNGGKASDAPKVQGFEQFSTDDTGDRVDNAVALATVEIPSATFKIEHIFRLVCSVLGDDLDPDVKQKIKDELKSAITQDQLVKQNMPTGVLGAPGQKPPDPSLMPLPAKPPGPAKF